MNIERLDRQTASENSTSPESVKDSELDKIRCSIGVEQQISTNQQKACNGESAQFGAYEFFQDLAVYPEDFVWEYNTLEAIRDEFDPLDDEFGPLDYEYGPDPVEEDPWYNGYDD